MLHLLKQFRSLFAELYALYAGLIFAVIDQNLFEMTEKI